jgi:hypothetical protein
MARIIDRVYKIDVIEKTVNKLLAPLRLPVQISGFLIQFSGFFPHCGIPPVDRLVPASIAGFGPAIPDLSYTSRLAAFSAPRALIGLVDTPSGARFISAA